MSQKLSNNLIISYTKYTGFSFILFSPHLIHEGSNYAHFIPVSLLLFSIYKCLKNKRLKNIENFSHNAFLRKKNFKITLIQCEIKLKKWGLRGILVSIGISIHVGMIPYKWARRKEVLQFHYLQN